MMERNRGNAIQRYLGRLAMARAMWARSRQLPTPRLRLVLLQLFPTRHQGSLAAKFLGGVRWRDCDETVEVREPGGDLIHFPKGPPRASRQTLVVYLKVAHLGQYFLKRQPGPGEVVLDVGGNIGCFVLPASRLVGPTGHVYTCEPVPSNLLALQRTIEANKLENVTIIPAAVGAERGNLTLNLHARAGGHSAVFGAGNETVTVALTTVDAIVADYGLTRLDFVKVDVEGFETEVLRGARNCLQRFRPFIAMSGYHRAEDLETLPRLLTEFCPEYVCDTDERPCWAERDIFCHVPEPGEQAAVAST